jgi:predicted enzyme related to lactoylglutathione lyase
LGLTKGYGDAHWQAFQVDEGSRFAIDFTSFPRSAVEKQAIVISFKVDDIRQAVGTLAARGVRFYPSAEEAVFDVGPSLVATFVDPDGNWMQLSQGKGA